jgi:hypothetical protein
MCRYQFTDTEATAASSAMIYVHYISVNTGTVAENDGESLMGSLTHGFCFVFELYSADINKN